MTFVNDFYNFFNEHVRPISSEVKAHDDQEDELSELVDDLVNNVEVRVEGEPSIITNGSNAPVEGERMETSISHTCEEEITSCENPNDDTMLLGILQQIKMFKSMERILYVMIMFRGEFK